MMVVLRVASILFACAVTGIIACLTGNALLAWTVGVTLGTLGLRLVSLLEKR